VEHVKMRLTHLDIIPARGFLNGISKAKVAQPLLKALASF